MGGAPLERAFAVAGDEARSTRRTRDVVAVLSELHARLVLDAAGDLATRSTT